uniref:hypothetical protein n=1 Tax=Escherichia coli TaxID=562 RepID=UPI001BC86211
VRETPARAAISSSFIILALFELQGPRALPGEGTEKCARDHIIEKHSFWVLDQFAETIQSECK